MSWKSNPYKHNTKPQLGDIILVFIPEPRGRQLARVTKVDGAWLKAQSADEEYEEHHSCVTVVIPTPGLYELATRSYRLR